MEFEGSSGSVEHCEASFGDAPEAFDAVEMDLALGERVALLSVLGDPLVLLGAVVDQAGLAAPSVADDRGVAGDMAQGKSLYRRPCRIPDDIGEDPPAALDEPQDRLLDIAAAGRRRTSFHRLSSCPGSGLAGRFDDRESA
jgi:hypothetical protein